MAGLPVNLEFLKRLAAHPAFVSAADLTTAFIKDHQEDLMAPRLLSPAVAAVAAVARHLLEARWPAAPYLYSQLSVVGLPALSSPPCPPRLT